MHMQMANMPSSDGLSGGIAAPPAWDVPTFAVTFSAPRRHPSCVVIPVLNEGVRILRLLERMAALSIAESADVVIVDGGSHDGSLEPQRLRALGVHTLLVKTGPGKLSAQLRCAYAFVLRNGYEAIVTIDGNDKDDPAAIPLFIDAIAGGVDFAQASRFLPGGVSENTPLARDLAIRWLHAPLLSATSGFPWTDTTQGYRGYSRRLLADPRLAIFRTVFDAYELLAFLSHLAPRLGFRCLELATSRRYPKDEVPTKITSVRGNLLVLRTLFKACLGRYDPTEQERRRAASV